MSEGGRSEENKLVENGVELRRGGSEMNSRLMSLLLPFPELPKRAILLQRGDRALGPLAKHANQLRPVVPR